MNYLIKIGILFTLISYLASAQINIGAYTGVSNTTYSGIPPKNSTYESKMGLNANITFDVFLTEDLAFSIQPGYMQKGTKLVFRNFFDDLIIDSSFTINSDYFSIPAAFKIYTASNWVYFLGGINFEYLNSIVIKDDRDNTDKDISYFIKDYDISMLFGIAFNYNINRFNLFAEMRYSQGFVNINNSNTFVNQGDEEKYIANFKNTSFSLFIGFNFKLFDL